MEQKTKTVSLKLHYATMAALIVANLCNLGLATLFATLYGRSLGYATYQIENNSIRTPGSVPQVHAAVINSVASRPLSIREKPICRPISVIRDGVLYMTYSNLGCYNEAMLAPSNLSATRINTGLILLEWLDNTPNEESYVIERSELANDPGDSAPLSFREIDRAPGNGTPYLGVPESYTDSGLKPVPGYSYYYRVRVYNTTVGYSPYTAIASVSIPLSKVQAGQ